MTPVHTPDIVFTQAQSILEAFYDGVIACGYHPPFKPSIVFATIPGMMRYDPQSGAVILIPYEVLPISRRLVYLGESSTTRYSTVCL